MADLSKDVLAFSEELKRMCRAYPGCEGCPAYSESPCDIRDVTPKLIDAVQKWSDEHPRKTYAQDFREKFHNCEWLEDMNVPMGVCRYMVYHGSPCRKDNKKCGDCWNEPMPEDNNA